jgi:hypothetical protein
MDKYSANNGTKWKEDRKFYEKKGQYGICYFCDTEELSSSDDDT